MTDYFPDWRLGEHRGPISEYIDVEYAGRIEAGDFLKITGVNNDGQFKVQKHTGRMFEIGVAQYNGGTGDFQTILKKGFVKVKVATTSGDGAVADGSLGRVKDGAVVPGARSGSGRECLIHTKGYPAYSAGDTTHETVVYFESSLGGAVAS